MYTLKIVAYELLFSERHMEIKQSLMGSVSCSSCSAVEFLLQSQLLLLCARFLLCHSGTRNLGLSLSSPASLVSHKQLHRYYISPAPWQPLKSGVPVFLICFYLEVFAPSILHMSGSYIVIDFSLFAGVGVVLRGLGIPDDVQDSILSIFSTVFYRTAGKNVKGMLGFALLLEPRSTDQIEY